MTQAQAPDATLEGRLSKVMTPEEAVARFVPEHVESLWVGGMHMHNVPMALVREMIRQKRKVGTLYAGPSTSISAELLIGSGLVDRVVVAYIGYEHLGLAPVFRRAAESGSSQPVIVEADAGSMTLGLQAGAWGQPFAALPPGIENTGLHETSPDFYVPLKSPFSEQQTFAVEAIRPQIALIHCQQADEFGNGVFRGSMFNDRLLAFAAETVLMQVEAVVDNNQILKYPLQTGIPAFRTSAVVPVNFGCHPTSSHRYYNYDDVHLRLYLRSAGTPEGFEEYLERFVRQPYEQEEYMRRVQNEDWSLIEESGT